MIRLQNKKSNSKIFHYNLWKDRKGQIATGMTWVIATVAIIFILVISVLVVSLGSAPGKKIITPVVVFNDLLAFKSVSGFLLTSVGGTRVFEQLRDKKAFEGANSKLAKDLFNRMYLREYSQIWMNVGDIEEGEYASGSPFLFTNPPKIKVGGVISFTFDAEIKLSEKYSLHIRFLDKGRLYS